VICSPIRLALLASWFAVLQAGAASAGAVSIEGMVASYGSKGELSIGLRAEPVHCQTVPSGGAEKIELCEWRFGNRDKVWQEYATAIATEDRVGIICAFNVATTMRIAESCTAQARRSDRGQLRSQNGHRKDKRRRKVEGDRRKIARAAATVVFDAARSFESLLRLIGEVPRSCEPVGDEVLCVWATNNGTPAHGSVVARFEGDYTKKHLLTCRFPADGSDRSVDSCNGAEGS
jgi:hypothetical protein